MRTQPSIDDLHATSPSIDRSIHTSIDNEHHPLKTTKSEPPSYTKVEIDKLVEEIYGILGASEDRLDRRCDDIYFPWDITISSLTSQTQAM